MFSLTADEWRVVVDQEKVWLFKHPEVELAVPEVLVPDLDGTGSEMDILFSLVLYMACGIVVFSPVK